MAHSEGSFVRWQGITITQLGYAVNLFLTFATASLGFSLSLIKDKGFHPGCWGRCLFDFSLLAFAASILFGSYCVLNRLWDFSLTKDIARLREDYPDRKESDAISEKRRESDRLGKRTWKLFDAQVISFALGVILLVAAISIVYHAKLF